MTYENENPSILEFRQIGASKASDRSIKETALTRANL